MNDLFACSTKQLIPVSGFEDFWDLYGKKRGRKKAEQKYNLAIKKVSHEEIIRGVTAYKEQCKANNVERQYIRHAATWLNNSGWADEYEPNKLERSQQAAVRGHIRAENPEF